MSYFSSLLLEKRCFFVHLVSFCVWEDINGEKRLSKMWIFIDVAVGRIDSVNGNAGHPFSVCEMHASQLCCVIV